MKSILICPAERQALNILSQERPLALVEICGKALLAYWLEHLYREGARSVTILAADRPEQVRAFTGDGTRWGLQVEVLPAWRELSPEEARAQFCRSGDILAEPNDAVVADHFPGCPERPLFGSDAGFFQALPATLAWAVSGPRIGVREIQPGVWAGLHARIAPDARLQAPCWIGEEASVGSQCVVGPGAFLGNGAVLEKGVSVTNSYLGPATFAGAGIRIDRSLVWGRSLIDWRTGMATAVPDPFLLCSLQEPDLPSQHRVSWSSRLMALTAFLISSPALFVFLIMNVLRGERAFRAHQAATCRPGMAEGKREIIYYELRGPWEWWRRWPRLWNIARGEFGWVGNPPLTPRRVGFIGSDFERLWVQTPPGFVSLHDVHRCRDLYSDEARAHAAYYATQKNRQLDWEIIWQLVRTRRAALMQHTMSRPQSAPAHFQALPAGARKA